MASANAGPISGRELMRVIQGGHTVWLNRTEFAQLVALPSNATSPRPYNVPTAFLGTEVFEAIQDGSRITMSAADMATYLAASGPVGVSPSPNKVTTLTGAERIVGRQDAWRVALSVAEYGQIAGTNPEPGPQPIIVPNVPINDIVLRRASGAGKITLGDLSIPEGDFTIHVAVSITTSASIVTQPILSIGNTSDTILEDNGTLNIFGSLKSGTTGPTMRTIAVQGRDDAGNWISDRSAPAEYGTVGRWNFLTSEFRSSNFEGMGARSLFVMRRGADMEFWIVDPGCAPILYDHAEDTDFGSIAAKPAQLVMINTTTAGAINNGNVAVQRVFRVSSALTEAQMMMVHQGADPRQVTSFSSGAGDRLWAFTATSGTVDDLVAGQTATISGTFDNFGGVKIIPTTVSTDEARIGNLRANRGIQRTGIVTTDIPLDGYVTGEDGDVYVQLVEYANEANVIAAWQNVATSILGVWSGAMTGVDATSFTRYTLQIRKGADGTPVSTNRPIMLSIVPMLLGQSLMQNLQLSGTGTIVAPATAATCVRYFGNIPGAQPDSYDSAGTGTKGYYTSNSTGGYGEISLINALAAGANCPVSVINAADNGSSIDSYISGIQPGRMPQLLEIARITRPGYLIWNQGHANSADGYDYKDKLETFYGQLRAELDWDWKFLVVPVTGVTIATSAANFDALRRAQKDFVAERQLAGDTLIFLGANVTDLDLSDGIHADNTVAGNGRLVERIAQDVLFMEGVASNSATGPEIDEVLWDGGDTLTVTFTQNGGTGIQKPYAAAATGFQASIDGTTILSQSDAQIVGDTLVITLASAAASAPMLRFGYGLPGTSTTVDGNGFGAAVGNIIYDNRTPYLNPTLGFPVPTWTEWVQSTLYVEPFFDDTMTGTNGNAMTGRSADTIGSTYAGITGFGSNSSVVKFQDNRVFCQGLDTGIRNLVAPPSADYVVKAILHKVSAVVNDRPFIAARVQSGAETLYSLDVIRGATPSARIYKHVAGTKTQIGPTYTEATWDNGEDREYWLSTEDNGANVDLIATLGGVQIISVTDDGSVGGAVITGAGFVGFGQAGVIQQAASCIHFDRVWAEPIV